MPRRRKKSTKRSLTLGIALEIATLAAIILLARPDWIVTGFQFAEQYRDRAQSFTPENTEQTDQPSQITADLQRSIEKPSPAIASYPHAISPAQVIPADDWLPGYFDVVGSPAARQPAVYISPQFAGQQPNTAFLPWPILPRQHF